MVLVKNEEYFLPYVLKQCEGIFDSYVIYDVGSTDQTAKVIEWFYERNKNDAHITVRKLPNVPPKVQGTFRNSMIAEGDRDVYLILDGDELYSPDHIKLIPGYAKALKYENARNPRKRYGVFERVEVSEDLRRQYVERRGHHRLYTKDAFWTGTHPGERAFHGQNHHSEEEYRTITCWHMHNTLRSSKEADATGRLRRKGQKSYHPGNTMDDLDLIKEIPLLATPIEDFKVSPALAALQEEAL